MFDVNLRKLMESGAHFGHQTFRWNPKMQPFIFTARNGIHIIDLDQTLESLRQAYDFIVDVVGKGKDVMFVGTKRQAQNTIIEACEACDMPYVVYRWLGGMLTNFKTIRQSVQRLEKIEETIASEDALSRHTKKELMRMNKDAAKLKRNLSGVAKMTRLPGALFVIDPKTERIAVNEALKEGIPIIAVADSNCDPDFADIVIPGNDDAIKAIELYIGVIRDACLEGKKVSEERVRAEATKEQAEAKKRESQKQAAEGQAKTPPAE